MIIPSNNDLSRVMGNCISISIGITYGMALSSVDCGNFKKNDQYLILKVNVKLKWGTMGIENGEQ